jgi:AhpD family alkylhydroperoxidase
MANDLMTPTTRFQTPAEEATTDGPAARRLDYGRVLPEATRAMQGLEDVVKASTLEPKLRELVKLRASLINGCAYCVDMHTKDAVAIGEDEQRLHFVSVWQEAPVFSARERAALAWTDALTRIADTGAPDDAYAAVAREFDPAEQVARTLAIIAINGWNRLSVGFRTPAGSYVSHRHPRPVSAS